MLSIYEVFKKIMRERRDAEALSAVAAMQSGRVVGFDVSLALDAARLDLPPADSIIYATARQHGAVLWTQDEDFENLPDVRYFAKK